MRIYFLLLTPLAHVRRLEIPPRSGDVVCYLRHAQDPSESDSQALTEQGIDVKFIDDVIDDNATEAADKLAASFLNEWFFDHDVDFTELVDMSLGISYSLELSFKITPRVLLRQCEAFRLFINANPAATEALTDAKDGSAYSASIRFIRSRRASNMSRNLRHTASHFEAG